MINHPIWITPPHVFPFTVNLKNYGPCHAVVTFQDIDPGEESPEAGTPPKIIGMRLESISAVEGIDKEVLLGENETALVLDYAENLILAGEEL